MRPIRTTLCAALALMILCLASPAEDWKPISPEELQMKEVPGAKGAHAAILYYEDLLNDKDEQETVYVRLKIFSEEGKKYANIETPPYFNDMQVNSFKARTIRPDGSVVPFDGKVFTKVLAKHKETNVLAKTFSIPDVQVGSIIEYRYIISWERNLYFPSKHFRVQNALYTRKAHIVVTPHPQLAYSYTVFNLPEGQVPVQTQRDITLDAHDLPPFDKEDYMPPEDELLGRMVVFKREQNFVEMDKFWKEEGKNWKNSAEKFMDKKGAMNAEVSGLVNGAKTPEEKLRRIYDRVQKIQNTTYEEEKTEKERQREKRKTNTNVEDVLRNGYGSFNQLNKLFVALARAAGFDATVVTVVERDHAAFHKNVLSKSQFDAELALVKLDGKEMYFSPGIPYCPFGYLSWEDTLASGLRDEKDGATIVQTPLPAAADTVMSRKANLTMNEEGSLTGELTATFTGMEALTRRMYAREHDEVERKKYMEDEIKSWLPTAGSTAELVNIDKWESTDTLVVKAKVTIPGYAAGMGKRVLLPAYAFQTSKGHVFQKSRRIQPIYFRNTWTDEDEITIKLPDGLQVESLPQKREFTNGPASYKCELTRNGNEITLHRHFAMDSILFEAKYYGALQQVFNTVKAGDDEQAVLKFGTVSSAAK